MHIERRLYLTKEQSDTLVDTFKFTVEITNGVIDIGYNNFVNKKQQLYKIIEPREVCYE